jgi:hypothetical protein
MDDIIQFLLAYNNNINVCDYFEEIHTKICVDSKYNMNDVLLTIIDILIQKHSSIDILTYDHIIPLLEYMIKQIRLNGIIMTRDKKKLVDIYTPIIPTLYQNSEFTKHVNRYIASVSITNNMMSLFTVTRELPPPLITIDDLLHRVERLENEIRELKLLVSK